MIANAKDQILISLPFKTGNREIIAKIKAKNNPKIFICW